MQSRIRKIQPYFKSLISLLALLILILPDAPALSADSDAMRRITPPRLHKRQLEPIGRIVGKEIQSGRIPGAVVLIGSRQKVLYRRAFGYRSLVPERLPMKADTIFDLASLTKVVATTTAIMQLAEKGKISLDEPAAAYWPEFGAEGKGSITVRQLLTHYSGLRPDLSLNPAWSGYEGALQMIISERPVSTPGTRFLYSDINFEVLGELVRRISGLSLDEYCRKNIFVPLGMKDTLFKPSESLCGRIAPTQDNNGKEGRMSCGGVHDPSAYLMGGVAGHAGLFSSADDLSKFAQMLLNKGTLDGVEILSPFSVDMMTMLQSPLGKEVPRGLGWEIGPPFCSNRDRLQDFGSYGHRGFTGIEIRIDSVTGTYVVILTNRVHPDGKGDAKQIRRRIADLIARSLGPLSPEQILPANRRLMENEAKKIRDQDQKVRVRTGIDVLSEEQFAPLAGLRVGRITRTYLKIKMVYHNA